jgi:hypothetical protein
MHHRYVSDRADPDDPANPAAVDFYYDFYYQSTHEWHWNGTFAGTYGGM